MGFLAQEQCAFLCSLNELRRWIQFFILDHFKKLEAREMDGVRTVLIIFPLLLLANYIFSYPLCTDLSSPFTPATPLSFCQYNGSVCCNSTHDLQLQNEFKSMKVSAPGCASTLKSILCSRCDKFSGELYRAESVPRQVPVLCNSTVSANSTQSSLARSNFCSKVWNECQNVTITNNPFGEFPFNSTSKLSDIWQSESFFCDKFGGPSDYELLCFDGGPVSLNNTEVLISPSGICLEKLGNGSYLNMAGHPDGSNRVFLSNQAGKIWLATIPAEGSGDSLGIEESNPFLDLTDEVYTETEFGMLGIAFHPNYQNNGRFFVSFNCDKVAWAYCSGRCSCTSNVGCDPLKLVSDDGVHPCRYHSVIAEFTANGSSSEKFMESANPSEIRRIFTMGLPFNSHHGGQILFGPNDGYLYFMMGDGGSEGDPYNFAQNNKSLLGKIMRLDIDKFPNATTISDLGLWGNYSIPVDNPFSDDKEWLPEIWALGLRNPWRCSFDLERPSYFLCADVGQDTYEEVDVVVKGGNYGWRVYEGPLLYNPPSSPGGNTSANSIDPIFPVMGYYHSEVRKPIGSAAITGGYYYRSMTDPCLYGWYVFADLYGGGIWAGAETPIGSGNFTTTEISASCANDSPLQCSAENGSSLPALGFILSFGQDNNKDVYILSSTGVYRIVRPSRCNLACSKETLINSSSPTSVPPSVASKMKSNPFVKVVAFVFVTAFSLLSF